MLFGVGEKSSLLHFGRKAHNDGRRIVFIVVNSRFGHERLALI